MEPPWISAHPQRDVPLLMFRNESPQNKMNTSTGTSPPKGVFQRIASSVSAFTLKRVMRTATRGCVGGFERLALASLGLLVTFYVSLMLVAMVATFPALWARLRNPLPVPPAHGVWKVTFFDSIYQRVSGVDLSQLNFEARRAHVDMVSDYGLTVCAICVGLYTAADMLQNYRKRRKNDLLRETHVSGAPSEDAILLAKSMQDAKRVTMIGGTFDFVMSCEPLVEVLCHLRDADGLRLVSTKSELDILKKPDGREFINMFDGCVSYNPMLEGARCAYVENDRSSMLVFREVHHYGNRRQAQYCFHEIEDGANGRSLVNILRVLTMHDHNFRPRVRGADESKAADVGSPPRGG
jgi:hypothetical protein